MKMNSVQQLTDYIIDTNIEHDQIQLNFYDCLNPLAYMIFLNSLELPFKSMSSVVLAKHIFAKSEVFSRVILKTKTKKSK
jgi:hypothetical protein